MLKLKILLEKKDYAVLLKPAHISVHSDGKTAEETVADIVLDMYPEAEGVGESLEVSPGVFVPRHGIVHRLDKDTTGLLIVARTNEGFDYFKSAFKNRNVKKTYYAFCHGKPRDERGIIDRAIGRSTESIRKWATGNKIRGEAREARTRYKIIKSSEGLSFAVLWPETGRTHQIRVHLSSIGHPIVADFLYGGRRVESLGFTRQALHAGKLTFKDTEGKEVEVEAPFPEDFQKALKKWDLEGFAS